MHDDPCCLQLIAVKKKKNLGCENYTNDNNIYYTYNVITRFSRRVLQTCSANVYIKSEQILPDNRIKDEFGTDSDPFRRPGGCDHYIYARIPYRPFYTCLGVCWSASLSRYTN